MRRKLDMFKSSSYRLSGLLSCCAYKRRSAIYYPLVLFTISFWPVAETSANEFLLGMDNSRLKLSSGVVRITGKTIESVGEQTNKEITENCLVEFDYEQKSMRFDRDGQSVFLQTPQSLFELWPSPGGDKQSSITQYEVGHTPSVRINPFDIRNIGFFTCYGSFLRSSYEQNRKAFLNEMKVIETEQQGRLTSVALISKEATSDNREDFSVYTIWVDKTKAYSTVRIKVGDLQDSEISWDEKSGVYVPVSFRQRYRSGGLSVDVDWTLTWESVNEPIPQERFTYQSLRRDGDVDGVLYSSNVDAQHRPVAIDHFGSTDNEVKLLGGGPNFNVTLCLLSVGIVLLGLGLGKYAYNNWLRKQT